MSIKAYDSFAHQPEDFPKTAIYTVHINGGIFMGRSLAPERTSFFSDQAILHPTYGDYYTHIDLFMAGQIKVINGKIIMVDGASGHFMPDDEQTSRALSFFESLGIINNLTELPYYRPINKGAERVYTPAKYTWLMAKLIDYSLLNEVDFREITESYLKEHAPQLYTVYTLQSAINKELGTWLDQSSVFYNRPSPHTIKLNNTVENFSRFGKYDQPALNLKLLADIELCINDWNAFHQSEKTTSRRQSAVDALEIRVMEHLIYNKLYLLFEESSYTQGDPTPYTTIIDNFLQRKIDLKIMIEQIKPLLGRPGPQFFSEKKPALESMPEEIENLFRLIVQFEKTSTVAELQEINRQLDSLHEKLDRSLLANLSETRY